MEHEWAVAIGSWITVLIAAGRPNGTVQLRRYQLGRFAAAMVEERYGPWSVTPDQVVAWLGGQKWSVETRRSWRSALRGFYTWAALSGRTQTNPALSIPSVKPVEPNPRPTPEQVMRAALAGADKREQAMVILAGDYGMRRGEVCQVHEDDFERDLDGWTLVVHGKGSKVRRIPINDGTAMRVRMLCRESGNGFAFPGRVNGHLSAKWVGKLVARRLDGAWTMHTLRHRFASVAFDLEHDIVSAQKMLGHSSLVTTQRYIKRPDSAMRRMVAGVSSGMISDDGNAARRPSA